MPHVVHSGSTFQNTTPAKLYEFFMNSAKHTAATGMPAKISPKVGGNWSAFGGMILGKNLVLIPNRMIVQTWRSSEWKKADPDSIWSSPLKNPPVAEPKWTWSTSTYRSMTAKASRKAG
jgi:hypothetical protein